MFGLMFHWQGVGEAWSLFAEESRRYPIAMTKGAFAFFDICKILFNLHRIQITVKCDDTRAVRWAKALGFIEEGVMVQYSADKEDTYIMRRL
jgi:RimJ/RimL family protein N-acetyltransferase